MHRVTRSLSLLSLLCLAAPLPARLSAQSMPDGFKTEIQRQFAASANKAVRLAEAVPADKYGWSPMDGVASVARVYMHIARYNYMYLEQSMGIDSPMGAEAYMRWEDDVTERFDMHQPSMADKQRVVEILTASMEHVRTNIEAMSESDLAAPTTQYGRNVQKWSVMLQLVTHMNEHLGQSIAYARMNGVVPPWSME